MRGARSFLRTALASLFVVAVFSSTAFATDYVVTTTADGVGVCGASDCSLRAAIAAANGDAAPTSCSDPVKRTCCRSAASPSPVR